MGGRASRDKGNRVERKVVGLLAERGITAERVPLSGAAGGSYSGDVQIGSLRAEVKARKSGEGFRTLEKWKGDNDLLILSRDRAEPLIVMDFELFTKMYQDHRYLELVKETRESD